VVRAYQDTCAKVIARYDGHIASGHVDAGTQADHHLAGD
jgi:hypothetical protein